MDNLLNDFSNIGKNRKNAEDDVCSLELYINILESQQGVSEKCKIIQEIALKCIPATAIVDIDRKLLQYWFPSLHELLLNLFKEISKTVTNATNNKKESLQALQEHLQMCITLLNMVDCVLEHIGMLKEVELNQIPSLPLNVAHILLATFQHCKDSEKLYNGYFEELKEIVVLFKAAQNVHVKYTMLMEKHVNYDSLDTYEELLKNVLECLAEIGEVLVDMNIKALADNWKCYVNLCQRFESVLRPLSFNIFTPLTFLSNEIIRNLNTILKTNSREEKASLQLLRLCNFFLKIVLKLSDLFWTNSNVQATILDFLCDLYCFYPPLIRQKGYPSNLIDQLDGLVFTCSEPLLEKLIQNPGFAKMISEKKTQSGLLYLFIAIFQNMYVSKTISSTSLLVQALMDVVKNSYCDLFLNVKIKQRHLYEELVITVVSVIVQSDDSDTIQIILLKNIVQDQMWAALLATDVWCLILRDKPSLCYETLLSLLVKAGTICCNRPEKVFIENFLSRMYLMLPEHYKSSLVAKYPPPLNLHEWKIVGLNFPKNKDYVIESLFITLDEKIDRLIEGKCCKTNSIFMCQAFESLRNIPDMSDINVTHLTSVLVKAWSFNLNLTRPEETYFKPFVFSLSAATSTLITLFNNEQLLLVLTKVRELLMDTSYRLPALQILKPLSSGLRQPSEKICNCIAECLNVLLLEKNPVLKQAALELFVNYLRHKQICQKTVRNQSELQTFISHFLERKVEKSHMSNDYYSQQKTVRFQHVCQIGNDSKMLMERIRGDIKALHKMFDKESVFEESIVEITNTLNRQIGCKI